MKTVQALAGSKKAVVAIVAAVIAFFGTREGMTTEQLTFVIGPLVAYIAGQSLADIGKEKVKADYEGARASRE